jgi:putative endonuclease
VGALFLWNLPFIFFTAGQSRDFYTGSTQDLKNRLFEHNSGETSSIKKGIPWEVFWEIKLPTRSEAMILETKIKRRGAQRFLEDVSRGA